MELGVSQSDKNISWYLRDLCSIVQLEWDLMSIDQYGAVPGSGVSGTDDVVEGSVIVVVCGRLI